MLSTMYEKKSPEIYSVFCSKKNDDEDFPDTDYSPLYWVPLASIFLFIVFFIIDGLIPRIYEWKFGTKNTKPSKRQSKTDVKKSDRKYNMNLLHNPEQQEQQRNSQRVIASTPQPTSSLQQSSSGHVS